MGWHGLDGDRPWHSAGSMTAADSHGCRQENCRLLLFAPHRGEEGAPENFRHTFVRRMAEEMPIFSEELAAEVGRRHGAPVQMMQYKHGIFDEGSISVIAFDTVREIDGSPGGVRRASISSESPRSSVAAGSFRRTNGRRCVSFGEGDHAPRSTSRCATSAARW